MEDSITGQLKQICESANKNICALAKRHAESGSEEEREKFEQEEILDSYRVVKIFGCTSPVSKDKEKAMTGSADQEICKDLKEIKNLLNIIANVAIAIANNQQVRVENTADGVKITMTPQPGSSWN